jgi:hypothetical protein
MPGMADIQWLQDSESAVNVLGRLAQEAAEDPTRGPGVARVYATLALAAAVTDLAHAVRAGV